MSELHKKTFEETVGFGESYELGDDKVDSPLCHCKECQSDLVYPHEWAERGPRKWWVKLHCPNCDDVKERVFKNKEIEVYDDALQQGTVQLYRSLAWITREVMAPEVEAFARALQNDHVTPEDLGKMYAS